MFLQFAAWVDAVIFVFSLENESSFNTIYNYYNKMAHFRNGQDLPMILVGTQGKYFDSLCIHNCTHTCLALSQFLIFNIFTIFN